VAPLPTPLDTRCPGPIAYGFRVPPGVYDTEYRFVETPNGGISCMVLSRPGAPPF
jgi:hypothetical protein